MIRSVFLKTASLRGYTWSRCEYVLRTTAVRCYSEYDIQDNHATVSLNKMGTVRDLHQAPPKPPCSRTIDRNPEDLYQRYLMTPDQPENSHLIRVAIIGAPNSGKSSLVNSLMGWKVTGVSKKVHTTRANTNTMFNIDDTQIILVDTPGVINRIQRSRHRCDGNMLVDPERSVQEADVVGVIVDVGDKWTRCKLNQEILKVLYLHKDVPSFLVLNKVDQLRHKSLLKQQRLVADVIHRLSCGVVAGKSFSKAFTERKKQKDLDPKENSDELFDQLEKRYGRLKVERKSQLETRDQNVVKKWTEGEDKGITVQNTGESSQEVSIELDRKNYEMTKMQNAVNDKILDIRCNTNESEMSMTSTEHSKNTSGHDKHVVVEKDMNIEVNDISLQVNEKSSEGLSESFEKESEVFNSVDLELDSNRVESVSDEANTEGANLDNLIQDSSYQSEHLTNILSQPPLQEFSVNLNVDMDEDKDWTDKVAAMKEAFKGSKAKKGWGNFDQVFLTSALDGTGIDDIKEYLVNIAKPRDWIYHSTVVTDQHPHDIAKMCVIQSFLEFMDNYLPYVLDPEIVYWDIDEHNRLNVAMDIFVNNSYEQKMILKGSETIKAISGSARQALMDAFQCEVRFKLVIKQKRGR